MSAAAPAVRAVASHAAGPRAADRLAGGAQLTFVLLVASLPFSIAPMSIAAVLCAVLTAASWIASRRFPWVASPVDLAGVIWLGALLVAALFAEDRAASLVRLNKGLMPLLVGLAAFHAREPRFGARMVALLLGAASVSAIAGAAAWLADGASFAARARGAVGHYMTYGGQLMLLASVAAGLVICIRNPVWRGASAAAGVLTAITLAFTFTRSAWLGLAAAIATVLGAWRARWLLALGVVLAVMVLLAPGAFRDRLRSAFDLRHPDNVERLHMWRAGAAMFRDRPLTGIGLQDLHPAYERYRPREAKEPAGHLHNVFVQIAATMGVIGLAAFVFLYLALFRCATMGLGRQLRLCKGPDPPGRFVDLAAGVRLGVAAGLIGFLVVGLFEWNFGDEELLYLLYTLVGVAWAARNWEEAEPESP